MNAPHKPYLGFVGFELIIGFRFGTDLGFALGACPFVAAVFGITMSWPLAYIGISAKSPEAVNTGGFMVILPLTFASSVLARPEQMPGQLKASSR